MSDDYWAKVIDEVRAADDAAVMALRPAPSGDLAGPVSAKNMPIWNRFGLTANNGSVVLTLAALDMLLTMAREAAITTLSEKLAAMEGERDEWKEKALDRGVVGSNWMDRALAAERLR